MKILGKTLATLLITAPVAASVPVRWIAETSRVQPEIIDAWRGDTLELVCTLRSYGQPVQPGAATASFLWQTNGMGNAWWQTNATVAADGRIRATWSPAMDPGAGEVAFFMPVQSAGGASYRAAGRIRFRPSPGAGSQTIDLPQPGETFDFGAYQLVNAPWATLAAVNSAIDANNTTVTNAMIGMFSEAVQASGNALASQINAVSNAAMQRAEMGEYATTQAVSMAIAAIPIPSLAGYATEQYVADYFATNYTSPDLSSYASRSYADAAASNAQAAAIAAIPSLAGYATEQYVADYFANAYTPPDLSSYASRSYADAAASNAQAAAIAAIPSLTGYATEQYVADYFATYYTPPDLSSYASRSYADEAASNAQAAAIAAIPSLAGYATEQYVGDAIAAIELPSLDGYATTAYANATASNAQAAAIAAIPSLAGYATETYAQSAAESAASDALSAARSYARDLSWATSEGNTRLVSPDGMIWQDATGAVWQVSAVLGWSGTTIDLSTSAATPVVFQPTSGTPPYNFVSNSWWTAGVGTNLFISLDGMAPTYCIDSPDFGSYPYYADGDPPLSATNLTFTSPGYYCSLTRQPVALATNPVDRVLYESSGGGGGADPGNYAVVSNRAMSAVTTNINGTAELYGGNYGLFLHPNGGQIEWQGPDVSAYIGLPRQTGTFALTSDIQQTNGFFRVDKYADYDDYVMQYGTLLDDGAYKWTLGFPNDATGVSYWLPSFTEGSSDTQIPGEWGYDVYLASRGYVQQQVGLKASISDITAAITPVSNKVETTATIVDSWESYWGATNVELRVTDYYGNTTGALPRLQIRESRDGHWTNVWDEVDKFIACKAEILNDVAKSNETVLAAVEAKYAPKAWGSHTDKGTTNVIPNSVYMTSPETYFGGGTEFQRVAVGSGAVSVLVDRGALAKTTGAPGTFRFQDAGGTNYFGFVKSDSYTIGCRTDGISVGAGNAITLRYDVIMSGEDVPVVYWKQQLESATPWAQLNNPDGTAADGAPYAVTWLQDGGSYYATVNCGGSPSGFFVAETSVAGDVVWETNMKARLGGGIECTNTATHVNGVIRPSYNGSTVTWEWRAR